MRYLVVTALLAALASCFTQSNEELRADIEKTSSFTQELSVCASSCDPPSYNGVPVSCASNYGCFSDPGGAYCYQGYYWQYVYCVPPPNPCGNGACEPGLGENYYNCSVDCPPPCGNGTCDAGENGSNCPADCPPCGNGTCDAGESVYNCEQDCRGTCGDGVCNWYYENEISCRRDCGDPNDCNPICR